MTHERFRPSDAEGAEAVATSALDRVGTVRHAFEAYHEELLSFLRRATRDDEAAEDLAQDAFERLTKEVEAGRRPDDVRAWLYRVASNLTVSRARRRSTVVAWLARHGRPAAANAVHDSPETGLLRNERRSDLLAALAKLSPEARTALLLAAEGFTGIEIAAALGRTHGATRSLMSRARVAVRLDVERAEERG